MDTHDPFPHTTPGAAERALDAIFAADDRSAEQRALDDAIAAVNDAGERATSAHADLAAANRNVDDAIYARSVAVDAWHAARVAHEDALRALRDA